MSPINPDDFDEYWADRLHTESEHTNMSMEDVTARIEKIQAARKGRRGRPPKAEQEELARLLTRKSELAAATTVPTATPAWATPRTSPSSTTADGRGGQPSPGASRIHAPNVGSGDRAKDGPQPRPSASVGHGVRSKASQTGLRGYHGSRDCARAFPHPRVATSTVHRIRQWTASLPTANHF